MKMLQTYVAETSYIVRIITHMLLFNLAMRLMSESVMFAFSRQACLWCVASNNSIAIKQHPETTAKKHQVASNS